MFDVLTLSDRLPPAIAGGLVLAVAYGASAMLQPMIRRFAINKGFVDTPDGERRKHQAAVPRLGGVGVFSGLLIAGLVGLLLFDTSNNLLTTLVPFVLAMATGAFLLFVTGLVDDLLGVPPVVKMIVQSCAAIIVWRFGFRIDVVLLPPAHTLVLGAFALPVTILWIVGISNAFNLVDGADGLAGGVAIVALIATATSAWIVGDLTILWCALGLACAMAGFLRYNLPPARIFLGDSGSLVVGFLLAVLTVKGMSRRDGAVYAIAPIFALSYPLLDTGIAMLRRWLRGDPLSRGDGEHIHHQLQSMGLRPRQTLGVLYGSSALVALLGILATFAPPHITIAVAVASGAMLLLVLVYGAKWLEYHEFFEAGASLTAVARHGRARLEDKIYARDLARVIENARSTQELNAIIEDSAETFQFAYMRLRWGVSRETPPFGVLSDVQGSRLWAMDYPIVGQSGVTDPLFLSIWCHVERGRPSRAERVARILAPALERWLQTHEYRISSISFPQVKPVTDIRKAGRSSA